MAKRKALPAAPVESLIESLSHDGRGLTHVNGKATFVQGALSGERVRFRYTRCQRHHDEGEVIDIITPSPLRVAPKCAHFGVCGGCSLQHLAAEAQIELKQGLLAEILERIGKVKPERWLAPLTGDPWGYRHKARLGVRYVAKKQRVLVGFRERGSSFIADLQRCEVLHPSVGTQLVALAELIGSLSIRSQVAQLEMARDDHNTVLIVRVLAPPTADDLQRLHAFAAHSGLVLYLQPGGLETIAPLGAAVDLAYALPDYAVRIGFAPTDFTQVNFALNRRMVAQAMALLDPQSTDQVLDLFCGVGNFTLPLARHAGAVVGIEGDARLVAQARANAAHNGLNNVQFECADLYQQPSWGAQKFTKALIDPPRSGAWQVLDPLAASGVQRLLYVSCYPTTLARDAEHLVHQLGYRLVAAGAMDLFAHTAHSEAMALFER